MKIDANGIRKSGERRPTEGRSAVIGEGASTKPVAAAVAATNPIAKYLCHKFVSSPEGAEPA
jgi:hypothetical protein